DAHAERDSRVDLGRLQAAGDLVEIRLQLLAAVEQPAAIQRPLFFLRTAPEPLLVVLQRGAGAAQRREVGRRAAGQEHAQQEGAAGPHRPTAGKSATSRCTKAFALLPSRRSNPPLSPAILYQSTAPERSISAMLSAVTPELITGCPVTAPRTRPTPRSALRPFVEISSTP